MTDNSSDMEKKLFQTNNKSLQGPPGQDSSRARQDGSGASQLSKNFPKSSSSSSSTPRRRDSPNNHQQQQHHAIKTRSSEPTNVRKPLPQKSKAMDKRPRARSGVSNQPVVEEEGEDSDKGPELGSLQTPGGKKQSLNHLLNFHFAPRDRGNGSVFQGSWRSYNSHPGGGWRSRHGSALGGLSTNIRPKFNKENFLQANCQFLVKADGDYTAHLHNPDMLVDWDSIEQIYIRVSGEVPNCPICLSPPIAAKMTRCGHIFCWPCLLHYLALSDKKSRKCPICFEPVFKHELKSVVVTHCDEIHIGDEIEMQLMVRKKGVFKAMPLMCQDQKAFEWEPIFSKLLEASPAEVKIRVLDREKVELERRFTDDEHTPEVCFVEQAMRELDTRRSNTVDGSSSTERKLEVFGALNLPCIDSQEEEEDLPELALSSLPNTPVVQQVTCIAERQRNESTGNDSVGSDDAMASKSTGDDHFYFYQAVKGENIFLHPINMAMLWKSFGPNPASWPQVIQLRVIDSDHITMMEDMRKRLKFLQHLPLTTNVQLVEVDLRPPVISSQVLAEFAHQLESRRKRRTQRARDERRRERKLEEEERKRLRGPQFELDYDFPQYHLDEEQLAALQLVESVEGALNVSTTDDENSSTDRNSNLDFGIMSSSPTSMSFAQIVSQKSSQTSVRSGAWGRSPAAAEPIPKSRFPSDSEAEPEEYSVPAFRMSVSDAIAKAIANVNTAEDLEAAASNTGGGGGSKKKGRRKGKVLFTTGMGCMQ